MRGSVEMLELLHANGANVDQTSPAGIGPLYLAIKAQQTEAVSFLLEAGARPFYSDPIKVDYSPVFLAVKMSQVSVIEGMCDTGAQMDEYKDSQGYTPLTLALKHGLHDVVNYLSLRGCNMNQEDPSNRTPLMYYILFAEELLGEGEGQASKLKLLEHARKFVARGADINHTSKTS